MTKQPQTPEDWETHIFHNCYDDGEEFGNPDMPYFLNRGKLVAVIRQIQQQAVTRHVELIRDMVEAIGMHSCEDCFDLVRRAKELIGNDK